MTAESARPEPPVHRPLERPSRLPLVLGAIALLAGSAALVWMYRGRGATAPPPPAPPAPAAEIAPQADGAATATDEKTTRGLLEAISADALLRKVLTSGDEVRRWAVVTANLALGESPRRELQALAPARPFAVERRGDRTFIAPDSYARYDAFADAVASIDAGALTAAFRALHPALQAAYRALGYPYPSIDAATAAALRRIEKAPVRDGDVPVQDEDGVYAFADSRLENLGPVEKHLLRMGPRNTRLIQAKAKEIEAALGLRAPRVTAEKR